MADADLTRVFGSEHSDRFVIAQKMATSYLHGYVEDEAVFSEVNALLEALRGHPNAVVDSYVCSHLSIIKNHHIWKYWYYEGIPFVVRIVYLVAIESKILIVPDPFVTRWNSFKQHMHELKVRDIAIRRSDRTGGWLFPGEPQILWEIARLAADRPGVFCELGTWAGRSATILCAAAQHFAPNKRVLLVDNWQWGLDGEIYPFMAEGRNVLVELERHLEPYADVYETIEGNLLEVFDSVKAALNGEPLSLLHHDAGHDYDHVFRDLELYIPLLAEGGYLIVHDYNHPDNPGTRQAVDEIVSKFAPELQRCSIFNTIGLFRKGDAPGLKRKDWFLALGVERSSSVFN